MWSNFFYKLLNGRPPLAEENGKEIMAKDGMHDLQETPLINLAKAILIKFKNFKLYASKKNKKCSRSFKSPLV